MYDTVRNVAVSSGKKEKRKFAKECFDTQLSLHGGLSGVKSPNIRLNAIGSVVFLLPHEIRTNNITAQELECIEVSTREVNGSILATVKNTKQEGVPLEFLNACKKTGDDVFAHYTISAKVYQIIKNRKNVQLACMDLEKDIGESVSLNLSDFYTKKKSVQVLFEFKEKRSDKVFFSEPIEIDLSNVSNSAAPIQMEGMKLWVNGSQIDFGFFVAARKFLRTTRIVISNISTANEFVSNKDSEEERTDTSIFQVGIELKSVGISFITPKSLHRNTDLEIDESVTSKPTELFYGAISKLEFLATFLRKNISLLLQMKSIQIDNINHLANRECRVLLFSRVDNKDNSVEMKKNGEKFEMDNNPNESFDSFPCSDFKESVNFFKFEFNIKTNGSKDFIHIPTFSLSLLPFHVSADLRTIFRTETFIRALSGFGEVFLSNSFFSTKGIKQFSLDSVFSVKNENQHMRVFFGDFSISEVQIYLSLFPLDLADSSFDSSSDISNKYIPFFSFLSNNLKMFNLTIRNKLISLRQISLESTLTDMKVGFPGMIKSFYLPQIISAIYSAVLSMEVLCNPGEIISSVKSGIVSRTLDSTLNIGALFFKNTGDFCRAFSLKNKPSFRIKNKKPSGFVGRTTSALKEFGTGVSDAISGVVISPYDGAKQGGVWGFVKGVFWGFVNVPASPLRGTADMISGTLKGLRTLTSGNAETEIPSRVRPARVFDGINGAILKYDENLALALEALFDAFDNQIPESISIKEYSRHLTCFFMESEYVSSRSLKCIGVPQLIFSKDPSHHSVSPCKDICDVLIVFTRSHVIIYNPNEVKIEFVVRLEDILKNKCVVEDDYMQIYVKSTKDDENGLFYIYHSSKDDHDYLCSMFSFKNIV